MGRSEVIVSEEALNSIASAIRTYIHDIHDVVTTAEDSITANKFEWTDDDFDSLLSAINSIVFNVDVIDGDSKKILERINKKIEAIQKLHKMTI